MLIGSISSLLDNWIKLAMARQRPSADQVHILTQAPGFSYPSGHALFFTSLSFMLAFSLAIGNHFIGADHGRLKRRDVLDLAMERVLA